jgi:3-hydroxy-9,10-secoandrosta-1,3,5(10)-triene-9,17-dione monooxygenase
MFRTDPIAPPEPGLSAAVMVERARQLLPYLRDKAAEIEHARCIPPEVDRQLRDAGFYRMLQPRRMGGHEMEFDTFIDVMLELFRADGAAGWVTCFMAAHILWITALEEHAQREIFGSDGDVRTVVPAAPTGRAIPVEGGYRISGRWDYCSGMSVANWFVALAVVERAQKSGPPEIIMFATACSNVTAEDNWHVLGLRGTGSVSARTENLLVPLNYCASFPGMVYEFSAPGYGVHDNPFYRAPLIPVLWMQLAVALIGMTQGLIDIFVKETGSKPSSFPPFGSLREDKKVQLALGSAIADHDVARAALGRLSANQSARIRKTAAGHAIDWAEVQSDHVLVCKIARLCVAAADGLFQMAGSSLPIKSDSAFQRFYRDIKVASTHRALGFERAAENSGMAAFGLAPATKN